MSNVGYATLSVIPSMKGFGAALSSQATPQMAGAGRTSGKAFGGGMVSSAKAFVGPLAGIFAVGGVAAFFKNAVGGASDLAESASKVKVVFGDQAAAIMRASETSATAMGLSKAAYLDAAGSLGNLLVSLEIAPKAAAGMSQEMVQLAGDMASFNNVSPEEALMAIRSGLTGETEPLKRFGVNMNDATLKAQALKLGLIATTKDAMSPQTKALAAQALIMAQTGTAQGDFARTSSGLANQQRIAAAQTEDLMNKIGKGLLPAVTAITKGYNYFTKGILDGTGAGGLFRDVIVGVFAVIGAGIGVLGSMVGFVRDNATAFKALGIAIGVVLLPVFIQMAATLAFNVFWLGALTVATFAYNVVTKVMAAGLRIAAAAQWLLNVAMSANPIGLVIIALVALAAGLVYAYTHSEKFRAVVQAVFTFIKTFIPAAVSYVVGFVRSHWKLLLAIITGPVGAITIYIISHWSQIKGATSGLVSGVIGFFGRLVSGVRTKVAAAVSAVKALPGKIKGALGNLGGVLWNAGVSLIQGFINGIVSKIGAVQSTLSGLTSKLTSWKGPESLDKVILHNSGQLVIQGFIGGLESQYSRVESSLGGLTTSLAGGVPIPSTPRTSGARASSAANDSRMQANATAAALERALTRSLQGATFVMAADRTVRLKSFGG